MYLSTYETHTEKLWKDLETNNPSQKDQCIINSSALWAHSKMKAVDSGDNVLIGSPTSAGDDTDLVRLEVNEARKLGIRSPYRLVRSRYYVTSASHLFSLFNFFKYAHHLDPDGVDENSPSTEDIKDLHYLSHIVLRVWRSKDEFGEDKNRLEVLVSSGAKDGFGQNYELLAKNAKSQKHKYKRHIQRFKLNSAQGRLLCKRCHSSIDYNYLKDHTTYVKRYRDSITNKNFKRSVSLSHIFKLCVKNVSEFNIDNVDDVQFLEYKNDVNSFGCRGLLCSRCFIEDVFSNKKDTFKYKTIINDNIQSSFMSNFKRANTITIQNDFNTVNLYKNATDGNNTLIDSSRYCTLGGSIEKKPSLDFVQTHVPPYCELSKLVVINRNFGLSKFKHYVNEAINKFLNNSN